MNAYLSRLVVLALISGTALVAEAGLDEPQDPVRHTRRAAAGTALDDDSVRPLERSRRPIPAIEQDYVRPEPKRPAHARSADDEIVRPRGPVFMPERALDDFLPLAGARGKRVEASQPRPNPAAGPAVPDLRNLAEDPAGRASEAGRPMRKSRAQQ